MTSFDKNMKIKCSEICLNDAEKTKGNWFIYEFSNSVYDALSEWIEDEDEDDYDYEDYEEEEDETLISSILSEKELKLFSVSVADRTLGIIRQWKEGKDIELRISSDLVKDLLNKERSTKAIDRLATFVTNNLQHLLEICQGCPAQCIHDLDGKCHMFDSGPY